MLRVAVLGAGGAGKTVLANRLGELLGIEVVHLDALRYDQYWQTVPEDRFAAAQRAVVAGTSWIVDGNSLATMAIRVAAADTIILLDPPPLVCLCGIRQRRWRYRGGQHPDGVYDRITLPFLRYTTSFRRDHRPRVLACIAEHSPHAVLYHLTSRRQANRLLTGLARHQQDPGGPGA
jgi:adenylate kinase family enzyme